MENPLEKIISYHNISKHSPNKYAPGPRGLDWANQPNPFRSYEGASLIPLNIVKISEEPFFDLIFTKDDVHPAQLSRDSISQFFYDSLALSAWKQSGMQRWSLRVNPASGNLQPTEAHIISGPIDKISEHPFVAHYAPKVHGLEIRTKLSQDLWENLIQQNPKGTFFVGLTSIHWRTAWKYGERAFRYVNIDLGHALSALGISAAGLGWQINLVDSTGTEQILQILGIFDPGKAEPEYPDCLISVSPAKISFELESFPTAAIEGIKGETWNGVPNKLSRAQINWPQLESIAKSTIKPSESIVGGQRLSFILKEPPKIRSISLRQIIHQRRSALGLDRTTYMTKSDFYQMLIKTTMPLLPWGPYVHLGLFVHRVEDLKSGLYLLVRDPSQKDDLKEKMNEQFEWQKPKDCPEDLLIYLLIEGEAQTISRDISCFQEIASDGCFSMGMISKFKEPITRYGSWFYPRLYWEPGMIGQILYLEAETRGFRACGVGCYFDDLMHDLLGLKGYDYQDLYHFTVGKHIEDTRLATLPPYPNRTLE